MISMKFRNDTGKDVMIQIERKTGTWITVDNGSEADLSEKLGNLYNLTPVEVKAVESKAGPKKVETKKKVAESERDKIISIRGIDEEIADALLIRFKNIEGILNAGAKGITRIPGIGKSRSRVIIKALS